MAPENTKEVIAALDKGRIVLESITTDSLNEISEKLKKSNAVKECAIQVSNLADLNKDDNVFDKWYLFDKELTAVSAQYAHVKREFDGLRLKLRALANERKKIIRKLSQGKINDDNSAAKFAKDVIDAAKTYSQEFRDAAAETIKFLDENIAIPVSKTQTFTLDLDALLNMVPLPRIIIWDSNFAADLHRRAFPSAKDSDVIQLNLSGEQVMPPRMREEITRPRRELGGKSLIPPRLCNYFITRVKIIEDKDILLTPSQEQEILDQWKKTVKGNDRDDKYTFESKKKIFIRSADFEILKFCYKKDLEKSAGTEKRGLITFTSDTDINETRANFQKIGKMKWIRNCYFDNDNRLRVA